MLKSLTVNNFALVDQLDMPLQPGLTVVTGESGAGKSVLIGALALVLGERAATDAIRPGAQRADVSAEFDLTGVPETVARLTEQALEDPDQPARMLVRRVVNREGPSRAFLNGTPVTLSVLRELTDGLVDIHGQDDNQRLADPNVQRALLDAYGVNASVLSACSTAFHAWRSAAAEHARREADVTNREDRASLLTYQLGELDEAKPLPGEFEEVEQRHRRLSQAQHLKEVLAEVLGVVEDDDGLRHAQARLDRLDDDHPDLRSARDALLTILELRADAVRDLRSFADSLDFEPEHLAELESRLEALHDLARKHRVDPERLPELIDRFTEELDAIGTDRSLTEDLAAEAARQEALYRQHAAELSRQRQAAADGFCHAVSGYMDALGIKQGALAVKFLPRESEYGAETVEYQCITNPKYPAAPLNRIASGGERARISLAIQLVAAERTRLPSLILDEADVGIGGTTADVVGRLLRTLAAHTQVICITHAPQIAALGTTHLKVHKDSEQDIRIARLDESDRIDELARMLAGARIGTESRDYARTLLEEAAG
jgi:DNA repair protein RecN (Recombination protein N)